MLDSSHVVYLSSSVVVMPLLYIDRQICQPHMRIIPKELVLFYLHQFLDHTGLLVDVNAIVVNKLTTLCDLGCDNAIPTLFAGYYFVVLDEFNFVHVVYLVVSCCLLYASIIHTSADLSTPHEANPKRIRKVIPVLYRLLRTPNILPAQRIRSR